MDPFVVTILKQSGVVALVGLLAAAIFFIVKYAQLQHALTLNPAPPTLP